MRNKKEDYLKRKKIRKRQLIVGSVCGSLAFVALLAGYSFTRSKENNTIGDLIEANIIDETQFTPRFIDGVTEAVPINNVDISIEHEYAWRTEYINDELLYRSFTDLQSWSGWNDCRIFDLSDSNNWGNIGMRYNNVGIYNDKIVDMCITFNGATEYSENIGSFENFSPLTNNVPTLAVDTESIHYYLFSDAMLNPSVKITFYEHGTDQEFSLNGLLIWRDVDNLETFTVPLPENHAIYLANETNLDIEIENNIAKISTTDYNAHVDDTSNWIIFSFQGDSLTFNHTSSNEHINFKNVNLTRTGSGGGMLPGGINDISIQNFTVYK